MDNLKSLIKVLDLRANIAIYANKREIAFVGKVFELMNNEQDYMNKEIKEWYVDDLSNELRILLR